MRKTYTENHYDDWRDTDVSNTLRSCGATARGGGEVLVVQRRFSNVIIQDTEICPTIEAGGGRRMEQLANSS